MLFQTNYTLVGDRSVETGKKLMALLLQRGSSPGEIAHYIHVGGSGGTVISGSLDARLCAKEFSMRVWVANLARSGSLLRCDMRGALIGHDCCHAAQLDVHRYSVSSDSAKKCSSTRSSNNRNGLRRDCGSNTRLTPRSSSSTVGSVRAK